MTYILGSFAIMCLGRSIGRSRNIGLKVQVLGTTVLSTLAVVMRIQFSLVKHGFLLSKSAWNSSQNLWTSCLKVTLIFIGCIVVGFGAECLQLLAYTQLAYSQVGSACTGGLLGYALLPSIDIDDE